MASRTQIVCLHEGERGRSIDPLFIRNLLKTLNPSWIRPWKGNNVIRTTDCGGRTSLIARMPAELRSCLAVGGETTLMVWADLDHDKSDGDALKDVFWDAAQKVGITKEEFDQVVFIFAKDRLENWIEYLLTGKTNETQEGPRMKNDRMVADAARLLAQKCLSGAAIPNLPSSLAWSCLNWRALVKRMKS